MPADHPLVLTTEVVPFTIRAQRLEVLLVQQALNWRLPGGTIGPEEDLDQAVQRHLLEQTGLQDVYLEQLYTFGQPDRDPAQRAVAVAYYALVPIERLPGGAAASFRPAACWVAVENLPALALDHAAMIALAHRRLASKLAYSTIALTLMPTQFTLRELQAVHETILGEPLDKRNFRKRILSLDCIDATGEMARCGGHRPAKWYRVKRPGQVDFIK